MSRAPTEQILGLHRRTFMRVAAGATCLPVVTAGCSLVGPASPALTPLPNPQGNRTRALPTHIAFSNGPQPDLPGSPSGVDPAYFKFPGVLVRSVPDPPGDGSDVSAITFAPYGTPPPLGQNPAWQAVNRQTGVTFKLTLAPSTEYAAKLNTMIAGSDIPDFIYNAPFSPFGVIPSLPDAVRRTCADLSPFLAGDAVKDFPNLANYSTYSWQTGLIDGRLYGVPVSRGTFGNVFLWRQDLFERLGIAESPRTADDFKRMLIAATRPQDNRWGSGLAGSGNPNWGLASTSPLLAMFGAPNVWRLENGHLVRISRRQSTVPPSALCATCTRPACFIPTAQPRAPPRRIPTFVPGGSRCTRIPGERGR